MYNTNIASLIHGRQILMILTPAAILAAGLCVYYKKKKEDLPSEWIKIGTVKSINLYPLKSGKRIELRDAEVTSVGLKQSNKVNNLFELRDRFLVVYKEENNEFRTARTYPKLMLISVSSVDKNHLKLDAPERETLQVKIPSSSSNNEKRTVTFHCGERIDVIDCGNEVSAWLSRFLTDKESGLRLGYSDGNTKRDLKKAFKLLADHYTKISNDSAGIYSDLASVLLVNQKSVDDLNTRLEHPVSPINFRPNIIVDDPGLKPYAEDDWDYMKIGEVIFRNVRECTRCMMTTLDPETATRSSNGEPLKTLKQYRMTDNPENSPVMGIYLEVKKRGFISAGDNVFIPQRK